MGLCLPPSLSEETLQGFKYFRLLGPLFDHLRLAATERDRAGNRRLFYDQQQYPVKSLRQICWTNGTLERCPCRYL